jgi:hypothetical protein
VGISSEIVGRKVEAGGISAIGTSSTSSLGTKDGVNKVATFGLRDSGPAGWNFGAIVGLTMGIKLEGISLTKLGDALCFRDGSAAKASEGIEVSSLVGTITVGKIVVDGCNTTGAFIAASLGLKVGGADAPDTGFPEEGEFGLELCKVEGSTEGSSSEGGVVWIGDELGTRDAFDGTKVIKGRELGPSIGKLLG